MDQVKDKYEEEKSPKYLEKANECFGVAASFGFRRLIDFIERDEKIDKILPLITQQNKDIILLQQSYE